MTYNQWRIQGGRGAWAPLFLAKPIYIQCLKKIFMKLNLDFIVAKIRGVFGSVGGVYACVCESKSWPLLFFVQQRPNSEWYPRPFWSQKYMPDCRKSHLIFQNFLGEAPQTPRRRSHFRRSVRDFALLPASLSKIPGSALMITFLNVNTRVVGLPEFGSDYGSGRNPAPIKILAGFSDSAGFGEMVLLPDNVPRLIFLKYYSKLIKENIYQRTDRNWVVVELFVMFVTDVCIVLVAK